MIQSAPIGINNSSQSGRVLVGDLLRRDGQQSTIPPKKMIWSLAELAEISKSANLAGIDYQETNGGNFPSAAMQNGVNPFRINQQVLELTAKALTAEGKADRQGFTSTLFRGKSAYGLSTYTQDFIEANFKTTIEKAGNKLIRVFDGLNDIDSIILTPAMLELAAKHNVNVQAAIATGPSLDQLRAVLGDAVIEQFLDRLDAEQKQALENMHSDDYYINYAKLLLAKGFDSIVIKDLSGAFDEERIKTFIPKLRAAISEVQSKAKASPETTVKDHYIPIYLHYHSTNEAKAKRVVNAAIEAGVDAIETVNGPLGGGTGHLRLSDLPQSERLKYDETTYADYVAVLDRLTKELVQAREDNFGEQTREILELLEVMRLAGGAAPFAIANAKHIAGLNGAKIDDTNIKKLKPILEKMLKHIAWMHLLMGLPPEVTPIPKIKAFQAFRNLAQTPDDLQQDAADEKLYDLAKFKYGFDLEMVKFLNGHFGKVRAYISCADGSIEKRELQTTGDLKEALRKKIEGEMGTAHRPTVNADKQFPYLNGSDVLKRYADSGRSHLQDSAVKARALIDKYRIKAISYANPDELGLLAEQSQILAGGKNAIDTAIEEHSRRINETYGHSAQDVFTEEEREKLAVIPGFKYLFAPLFDYFNALVRLGLQAQSPGSPALRAMTLSEFGETAQDLRPVFDSVLEHLSPLDTKLEELKEQFGSLKVGDLITRFSNLINVQSLSREGKGQLALQVLSLDPDRASAKNAHLLRTLHLPKS